MFQYNMLKNLNKHKFEAKIINIQPMILNVGRKKMNRKMISFISIILLLSSITLFPMVTPQQDTFQRKQIYTFNPKNQPYIINENKESMIDIYEQMIDKIAQKRDPSEEISIFLSNPEVQKIIQNISDQQTLETINTLFSKQSIFSKIQSLNTYGLQMDNIRKNNTAQSIEQMIEQLIDTNLTYEESITLTPEEFFSPKNQSILNEGWGNYLTNNPKIQEIMDSLMIDPVIFLLVFAISIGIWGFTIGAMSCCMPELIPLGAMVVESLILGLAGSLLIDAFFSTNIPFLNQFIDGLCSLLLLSQTQLEVIIASLFCLIIIGTYLWIWSVCPISQLSRFVKAMGGGSLVVGPPFIFGLLCGKYFYIEDEPPEP